MLKDKNIIKIADSISIAIVAISIVNTPILSAKLAPNFEPITLAKPNAKNIAEILCSEIFSMENNIGVI